MHVLLISTWAVNPYQKLFVPHLQNSGVAVSEEGLSIRRVLFPGSPDILHLQNVRPFLTTAVRVTHFAARLILARLMGIKIVWTAHDLESPNQRRKVLDRLTTAVVARLAHRTIVHSEAARERLAGAARVSGSKVRVIPHGNYIGYYPDSIRRNDARVTLGMGEDEIVFLLFGWIKRYKQVIELIRAFRSLPAKNARLVIAGSAPERTFASEIRTETAGDPRILLHLRGIPDAEVQVFMNASDVAVFPYAPVLTSGAVVLAKSFGIACIASKDSGVEDTAGSTGTLVYDPAAEDALANALQTAIDNRDQLAQMGAHNRATAAQHDWRDVAAATAQLYREILGA